MKIYKEIELLKEDLQWCTALSEIRIKLLESEINRKSEEVNSMRVDKAIAEECKTLIKIKLITIEKADPVIEYLDICCKLVVSDEYIDKLYITTNVFITDYIENGDSKNE